MNLLQLISRDNINRPHAVATLASGQLGKAEAALPLSNACPSTPSTSSC